MPIRRLLLMIAPLSILGTPCHADRVYRLIDYPANQNGHFLKGTITTTDDAPSDSLLDVAEILSWQWSLTGANVFSASSQYLTLDATTTFGVRISPDSIGLPAGSGVPSSNLTLSRRLAGGRSEVSHTLSWRITNDPTLPVSEARHVDDRTGKLFWFARGDFPSSSGWIVAVAIPEPATALLATTCLLAWSNSRRR